MLNSVSVMRAVTLWRFGRLRALGMSLLCLLSVVPWGAAQANLVSLAADGAWTWYNDPRALFHHGKLYFGYVRHTDGRTLLNAFDPETGLGTVLWGSGFTQRDDHNNPGLLVKQDDTMLAIYARHGTDQFFCYRLSANTNPATPADWAAEQTLPATGKGLTYANPFQLSAEAGKIYNFSRNLNFNPTVFTSADGGATWSAPQLFLQNGTGSIRPYVKYASDDTRRIEFLYTDGHPRDVNNSLFHLYYQDGAFYKTDGTFVKDFSSLPVLHDAGERGSVIYEYSTVPTNDPNAHIPTGRAWCWEVVSAPGGKPVCVFTVQRDQVTGSNWYDDRIYYYTARWTGSNWQKRFIAHAGRPLYSSEDDYAGGICLDAENPDVLYLSSNAQDPFNLADTTNVPLRADDRYEIWRGVTSDGGGTFSWTQITTNSSKDNLRPFVPRRQSGPPVVIWFRGTYTTYSSYNCEVVGLFPNAPPQPPVANIVSPGNSPVAFTNLLVQLQIEATATTAGGDTPAVRWTTVNGPTNAVFSQPSATNTTAAFPLAGVYTLRCTATTGALSSFAEVTVHAGLGNADAPDSSRVLWLKLDETTGTVAGDASGNANDGALSGGAVWQTAAGIHGGAIKFDGSSGVITVPDAPALDNTEAFTLAYWFHVEAYPADSAGLVSKRDSASANNAYTTYLKATDKRIYVDIVGSDNRFASSTLIQTGVWYHVAVLFDGSLPATSRASLWINGRLDTTATESATAVPDFSSSFRLGNTPATVAAWFNGWVDDVRFYRRALGSDEIVALAISNTAPSVTAGAAPAAIRGVPALLGGSALDDGRGGPLTTWWSVVSGPGTASFANAANPATTVTFDPAGDFVLRLHASDSTATVCHDLTVNVSPNLNLYEDWVALAFPGVTNAAVIGATADPDGDGARNLLEFALGMTPSVPDAASFGPGSPGLPVGRIMEIGGMNYLTMRVQRPVGRIGISYAAEASANLAVWVAAVQAGPPSPNGDGTEIVTFRDVLPVNESSARFMRLKVTKP
jgi:hypothetical protein